VYGKGREKRGGSYGSEMGQEGIGGVEGGRTGGGKTGAGKIARATRRRGNQGFYSECSDGPNSTCEGEPFSARKEERGS